MQVEMIEWYDAGATNDWQFIDDIDCTYTITRTSGFVVKETENIIVVCATYDEETESVNACMYIPKSMIKKRQVVWNKRKKTPSK